MSRRLLVITTDYHCVGRRDCSIINSGDTSSNGDAKASCQRHTARPKHSITTSTSCIARDNQGLDCTIGPRRWSRGLVKDVQVDRRTVDVAHLATEYYR